MKELVAMLQKEQIELRQDCPLAPYSSFRVGGRAALIALPGSCTQLVTALRHAKACGVRAEVFGNASNVVFPDEGYHGLVIFTGGCREIALCNGRIEADCGVSLARLSSFAASNGLGGAEFLHGIPGTVGGAIFMNAGAFEGEISQICVNSTYYDRATDRIDVLTGDAHAFGKRTSIFQRERDWVLLKTELALEQGDGEEIRARMHSFMERRRSTQPLEYPSAGSVFKRPEGHFAGKLIQDCALKGYSIGGAQVSMKHAGFIINTGGATAADIRALTKHIQDVVLAQTGVLLECEIRFIEA